MRNLNVSRKLKLNLVMDVDYFDVVNSVERALGSENINSFHTKNVVV